MVCRVFQKSAGGKKYPSNQTRANNQFNLEIGPSVVPPIMQADMYHNPIGRNYVNNADMAELARVLRVSPTGNLPIQSQLNYPGGFTISGLNLNLGASTQPVLRATPPPTLNQQPMSVDASSSMLTSCMLTTDTGFGADVTGSGHNRFQTMEQCVDLESYWTPY